MTATVKWKVETFNNVDTIILTTTDNRRRVITGKKNIDEFYRTMSVNKMYNNSFLTNHGHFDDYNHLFFDKEGIKCPYCNNTNEVEITTTKTCMGKLVHQSASRTIVIDTFGTEEDTIVLCSYCGKNITEMVDDIVYSIDTI